MYTQVQDTKEINYVFFMMSFPIEERTSCVPWFTVPETIVTTHRIFLQRFGSKITWEERFISIQELQK